MDKRALQQQLDDLVQQKMDVMQTLETTERQIYHAETQYMDQSGASGNIIRGYDPHFFTCRRPPSKQARKLKDSDRLFSMSSASSSVERGEPANTDALPVVLRVTNGDESADVDVERVPPGVTNDRVPTVAASLNTRGKKEEGE